MFCGASSGSEPSLFFSNYFFSSGFKSIQDDFHHDFARKTSVFSALISILYLVQVLSRLSTRASSSCSSSARASMSSANRRLIIFLPPLLTFPSCSSRASGMIRSRKMLKRVCDRRHPCLTPTVVLNHSPMLPFIWPAHVALSMVRTRFALILYFRMVAHKAACQTLSKAFLKSVKTWYRFC